MRRKRFIAGCAAAVLLLAGCARMTGAAPDAIGAVPGEAASVPDRTSVPSVAKQITNHAQITDAIRTGMKEKARAVTVSFTLPVQVLHDIDDLIAGWMNEALAHTGVADEGDYLRYQYGGYHTKTSVTSKEDGYLYTVRIEPVYYATPEQEEQVTVAAAEILTELALPADATDEEKCAAVYDWLCIHVTYDRVHHKNPYNMIDATAYDALVLRTASCQGYCTALYRLLTELGVTCRIVTGVVTEDHGMTDAGTQSPDAKARRAQADAKARDAQERHAWCLVHVSGAWRILDPTFDAGHTPFRYFLIAPEDAPDHRAETGEIDDIIAELEGGM